MKGCLIMADEKEIERGEFLRVHDDTVKRVTGRMPPDETLYDLAELFKVFGDATRIKSLYILMETELCVGDMAQLLRVSQNAVSHQLRVLKQMKLVKNRRDGKTVYYSLTDVHIQNIISQGMEHILE